MLGHSTIQLTADTYTHLMAESKRELAEKMDVITPIAAATARLRLLVVDKALRVREDRQK